MIISVCYLSSSETILGSKLRVLWTVGRRCSTIYLLDPVAALLNRPPKLELFGLPGFLKIDSECYVGVIRNHHEKYRYVDSNRQ